MWLKLKNYNVGVILIKWVYDIKLSICLMTCLSLAILLTSPIGIGC